MRSIKSIWVVDLREVMITYSGYENFMKLLDDIPLKVILERVLSIHRFIDYSEDINYLLEEYHFTGVLEVETFTLIIECLIADIDGVIVSNININDGDGYLFRQWVGEYSMVLEVI